MGYIYVTAMKSVIEFSKALKLFAEEVGVPEAIIVDSHKCNKSKEVKLFCHKIGTTISILEGYKHWANRSELYVGLFEEALRENMLDEKTNIKFRSVSPMFITHLA